MRILVAGSRGQLARALIDAAGSRGGLDVVALGRPRLDLLDSNTIEAAFAFVRPDLVVNAAAYTAVDEAESDPGAAFAINRDGAAALAAAAARDSSPIIHISTDYVFDGTRSAPYVESDKASPLSVYGRSKLEGEAAVGAANPQHVILRTAWLFAPYGKNFLQAIVRLARERSELRVVADQRGNPTYVPHLAEAILAIASQIGNVAGNGACGIYHAAAPGETSWAGFAAEILHARQCLGVPTPQVVPIMTDEYPLAAKRPANSSLNCSKLRRTFGIRLPRWREGVRECVAQLTGL